MEHWYCAEVELSPIGKSELESSSVRELATKMKATFSLRAELELAKIGFASFNPTCLERKFRQRTRTHQNIVRPLFPGYLFVKHDPYFQVFQRMLDARGVLGLIKGAGSDMPARVNPAAMVRLQGLAAAGPIKDDRWMQAFAPQQDVVVTAEKGPWQGWRGKVQKSDKERVWVLMEIFGAKRPVEFPASALEAA